MAYNRVNWSNNISTPMNAVNLNKMDSTISDHDNQILEATGYGVISGLTVSAQGTPNMTVNVASGVLHMADNKRLTPTGNSILSINAADVTNPRIDIVFVNTDGSIGYTAGTPASTPVAPSTPVGAFLLAQINVSTNDTIINQTDITDVRLIKQNNNQIGAQLLDLAVHVGTYFLLVNNLGQINEDWSPAIQQAVKVAIQSKRKLSFPTGKILQVYTPINLSGNSKIIIDGNNSTLKLMGLTSTSNQPIMYFSSLSAVGSSTKSYAYNAGVEINDLTFDGVGYGIGYKHIIAGRLTFNNCQFTNNLEVGALFAGTNGIAFNQCNVTGKTKGIFCALNAEDSYSANYIAEGAGWNDGIVINEGIVTAPNNGIGFYYSGSTAEGIFAFNDVILTANQSPNNNAIGIYAKGFSQAIINRGWSELFDGDNSVVMKFDINSSNEISDIVEVKHHFFSTYSGQSRPNYCIYTNAILTKITGCHFHSDGSGSRTASIYYNSIDTTNKIHDGFLPKTVTITNQTTPGQFAISTVNFNQPLDFIITDGANQYYAQYDHTDTGNSWYVYKMYTFSRVVTDQLYYTQQYTTGYLITPSTNSMTLGDKNAVPTQGNRGKCILEGNIFQNNPVNKWFQFSNVVNNVELKNNFYRPLKVIT